MTSKTQDPETAGQIFLKEGGLGEQASEHVTTQNPWRTHKQAELCLSLTFIAEVPFTPLVLKRRLSLQPWRQDWSAGSGVIPASVKAARGLWVPAMEPHHGWSSDGDRGGVCSFITKQGGPCSAFQTQGRIPFEHFLSLERFLTGTAISGS